MELLTKQKNMELEKKIHDCLKKIKEKCERKEKRRDFPYLIYGEPLKKLRRKPANSLKYKMEEKTKWARK